MLIIHDAVRRNNRPHDDRITDLQESGAVSYKRAGGDLPEGEGSRLGSGLRELQGGRAAGRQLQEDGSKLLAQGFVCRAASTTYKHTLLLLHHHEHQDFPRMQGKKGALGAEAPSAEQSPIDQRTERNHRAGPCSSHGPAGTGAGCPRFREPGLAHERHWPLSLPLPAPGERRRHP